MRIGQFTLKNCFKKIQMQSHILQNSTAYFHSIKEERELLNWLSFCAKLINKQQNVLITKRKKSAG